MGSTSEPTYVVGIDFGYTHTGVAFARLEEGEIFQPLTIQRWPGRPNEVINKVQTKIAYKTGESKYVGWGFNLPKLNKRTTVEQYFKLNLDEELLKESFDEDDDSYDPEEYEVVKKLFEDFLYALYQCIKETLVTTQSIVFEKTKIEFIFSVPTTWSTTVVAQYESIIKKAGYTSVPDHIAYTGLTEAEAAAVYTAAYDAKGAMRTSKKDGQLRKYQIGDILLVCDAGGGTTDVSLLRVKDFHNQVPEMIQLGPVEGEAIGSVQIDEDFARLVQARLKPVRARNFDRKVAAAKMTSDEFQQVKAQFGEKSISLLPSYTMRVPGLGDSDSFPAAGVERGNMSFSLDEIAKLFDKRIEDISGLIDAQLKHLAEGEEYAGQRVKYLILSGGLGSSEYLRQKLEKRYVGQGSHPSTQGMTILTANKPQLVVCRGLVLNRIQEQFKFSVISGRCCRASYGITYDEPYRKGIHSKKERFKNPNDKQYYVPGKICWLMRKGEFVSDESPPRKAFSRAISRKKAKDMWLSHRIVRFDGSRNLPNDQRAEGIKPVCGVDCNLESAIAAQGRQLEHVRVQHRHRIMGTNFGGKYYEVDYEVVVRIGPANLKFDLWFDGKQRSVDREIRVDWKRDYKVVAVEMADSGSESESECEEEDGRASFVDSACAVSELSLATT